jgi:hypothetical protein
MTNFNFSAFIQTLIACMVISFCWGMFCDANNIQTGLQMVVSFCIGLFGSKVIYAWLTDIPDKAKPESEPPEEF